MYDIIGIFPPTADRGQKEEGSGREGKGSEGEAIGIQRKEGMRMEKRIKGVREEMCEGRGERRQRKRMWNKGKKESIDGFVERMKIWRE